MESNVVSSFKNLNAFSEYAYFRSEEPSIKRFLGVNIKDGIQSRLFEESRF